MIPGQIHSATVYTLSGGTYSVVHKTGLKCRLLHLQRTGLVADQRADAASRRKLMWAESENYEMPARCQVTVSGTPEAAGARYAVEFDTLAFFSGLTPGSGYWEADLVRANT